MGPGSPIYFDMEAYTRTSSATQRDAHLPRAPGPSSCTRSATPPASTAPAPPASPTSRDAIGEHLHAARPPLDRQLERQREHPRPLPPGRRLGRAPAHPPVPRRPRRDLGRDDDQHRQQLRRRRPRWAARSAAPALPPLTVKHVRPEGGDACASGSAAAGPKAKAAPARSSCAPTPGCRCAPVAACRPGSCGSASATAPSASPAASSHTFRVALNARGRPLLPAAASSRRSCWSRSPAPARPARSSSGAAR